MGKFEETHRARRGHAFLPLESEWATVPALYKTEKVSTRDKVVHLHYFVGGSDWWIVEVEHDGVLAFGFARLNGDDANSEWGYVDLSELESVYIPPFTIVERDCYWTPKPASEISQIKTYA